MDNKISIIIPAYNIQDYLKVCLDSVLAQTYANIEVIVVNDGSTDRTGEVIDAYVGKDCRIRAIHKKNGGVTSARLCGVAEATGEYISFIDGDDYIEPRMYEQLMENMKSYDADISHCGYRMVFPNGRVDYYYNTGRFVQQIGDQGCTDLLDGSFVEPGLVNKLYRKDLFVGLDQWMDRSVRINEDLLMNFYLFRNAKTAIFEDICPYYYVLRKGSAATSKLNEHKLRDPLTVLHILLDETTDRSEWNGIVERRLVYQLVNSATLSASEPDELVVRSRNEARKELRQRLWKILIGKSCNSKLKIMAFWASMWPWSYSLAHKMYARLCGTDKKFSLD